MTKKTTTAEFIAKAQTIHGSHYDYSAVDYTNSQSKISIICFTHGTFEQRPSDHLAGKGCRQCGSASSANTRSSDQTQFLQRANTVHGQRYDYSAAHYQGNHTKLTIICREHGTFEQTPAKHLSGQNCPTCSKLAVAAAHQFNQQDFLTRAHAAHGDLYNYSRVTYTSSSEPIEIVCRAHGPFRQAPANHWAGQGCRQCFDERNSARMHHSAEQFIATARGAHTGYDYSRVEYAGSKVPVELVCENGHVFWQRPNDHLTGHGCSVCLGAGISAPEAELQSWLESLGHQVTTNCRKALGTGREVDLLIGNLAIEYNGLYWHSEPRRDAAYHRAKTAEAAAAGLQMVHIFEDEWLEKPEIVKARLAAKLGSAPRRQARKLALTPVVWLDAQQFYSKHHLQGAGIPGKSFGLYDDKVLVACITFGRRAGVIEILRYASVGTVTGGFGRLFQHFVRTHPDAEKVVSFADLRWGEGKVYATQGFSREQDTAPGYFWVKKLRRYSRQKFQKHKLPGLLPQFDPALSEVDNMRAAGYARIFDCGHAKWVWTR